MSPLMAVKMQKREQDVLSLRAAEPVRRMNRDFQIRFTAILLALLTTAAVVYAGYNLQTERQFQVPDDGVWWVEHHGRLTAERVEIGGPGTRAGVKVGDQLTAIDQHEVNTDSCVEPANCTARVPGRRLPTRWYGNRFRWMWC